MHTYSPSRFTGSKAAAGQQRMHEICMHARLSRTAHVLHVLYSAGVDPMYATEDAFLEPLLTDWAVRTENPWEANLFMVPTYAISYSGT